MCPVRFVTYVSGRSQAGTAASGIIDQTAALARSKALKHSRYVLFGFTSTLLNASD